MTTESSSHQAWYVPHSYSIECVQNILRYMRTTVDSVCGMVFQKFNFSASFLPQANSPPSCVSQKPSYQEEDGIVINSTSTMSSSFLPYKHKHNSVKPAKLGTVVLCVVVLGVWVM